MPDSELTKQLHLATRNCQRYYGEKTKVAYESDEAVRELITAWTNVFMYRLKSSSVFGISPGGSSQLWCLIKMILPSEEIHRFTNMSLCSDESRVNTWLKSSLNDQCLVAFVETLLQEPRILETFYETDSILRDDDDGQMLLQLATGIRPIVFNLSLTERSPIPAAVPASRNSSKDLMGSWAASCAVEDSGDAVTPTTSPRPPELRVGVFNTRRSVAYPAILDSSISSLGLSDVSGVEPEMWESGATSPSKVEYSPSQGDGEMASAGEREDPAQRQHQPSDDYSDVTSETFSTTSDLSRPVSPFPAVITVSNVARRSEGDGAVIPPDGAEKPLAESLSTRELRELLLSVVEDKRALETENQALQERLNEARQRIVSLERTATEASRRDEQRLTVDRRRLSTLMRENDVLRQQLREFVSSPSSQASAAPTSPDDVSSMFSKRPSSMVAAMKEFEGKLVTVSEWHGELMELNQKLERDTLNKDRLIAHYRLELTRLRGPLPVAVEDAESALVSVWVPSCTRRGDYHIFQVFCRVADAEWTVWRRYSQFRLLHDNLRRQHSSLNGIPFPPKRRIGNKSEGFLTERRRLLETYLRCLVNHFTDHVKLFNGELNKVQFVYLLPFFSEKWTPGSGGHEAPQFDRNSYNGL